MRVADVMTRDPVWIHPQATPDEALRSMDENRIRHLPVLRDGELVGILSDRDLLAATGWLPASVHACRGPHGADCLPATLEGIMQARVATVGTEDSLVAVCVEFITSRLGCLPVVTDGRLVGIVTELDLLRAYVEGVRTGDVPASLDSAVSRRMTRSPLTTGWYASLEEASHLMRTKGIRHLPVLESERLVGMISDRDVRRAKGRGWGGDTPIDEFMTRGPISTTPSEPLSRAAQVLVDHKIGALPVVQSDELVGILSLSDLLDHCLESTTTECGDSGTGASRDLRPRRSAE